MSHKGFSLLSVLIAIGVLATIALIIGQVVTKSFRLHQYALVSSDIAYMRLHVLGRWSCDNTIATCQGGSAEIVDAQGAVIVSRPHTTQGQAAPINPKYALRANCVPCSDGSCSERIEIEYLILRNSSSSQPGVHPLTGKDATWTRIHDDIPTGCTR